MPTASKWGSPIPIPSWTVRPSKSAGQRSLQQGTTLAAGLDIVRQVTERTGKPALVMTYSNVVFQVGPEQFASRIAQAGASGLIVADLPFEEADPVQRAVEAEGLGMVLFAAPTTTDERLARLAEAGPAFIYGVAEVGVTGEREKSGGRAAAMVENPSGNRSADRPRGRDLDPDRREPWGHWQTASSSARRWCGRCSTPPTRRRPPMRLATASAALAAALRS